MPQLRPCRGDRPADGSAAERAIPDKLYFRIGEVSRLAQTKPYVLRYWETEFSTLKPLKSRSGHRLYRRADVEMVFQIRRLLYGQGFTIEGARKQLAQPAREPQEQRLAAPSALEPTQLKAIKRELESILTMLSKR